MVLLKAFPWMPGTGVGCTSCRELARASARALKVVDFVVCPGPAVRLPSNEGGLMVFVVWSTELWPISDWVSDSSTVDAPGILLDFLDSGSRGSSWHRCPMSRLTHLVHGLSCWCEGRGKEIRVNACSWSTSNTRARGGAYIRDHTSCAGTRQSRPRSVRTVPPIYIYTYVCMRHPRIALQCQCPR